MFVGGLIKVCPIHRPSSSDLFCWHLVGSLKEIRVGKGNWPVDSVFRVGRNL
jgi:hypothetical protein